MKSEKVSTDSKPVTRTKKSSAAAKTATPTGASHRHSKVNAPPAPVVEPTAAPVMPGVAAAAVEVKPVATKSIAQKPAVEKSSKPAVAAVAPAAAAAAVIAEPVMAKPVVAESSVAKSVAEPVVAEPVAPAAEDVDNATAASVSQEDIARLAYSYFVERNYQHGFAEQDWIRAEQTLMGSSLKAMSAAR